MLNPWHDRSPKLLTTAQSPLPSLSPNPNISERNGVQADAEELNVNLPELTLNLNKRIGQLASTKAEVNELKILLKISIAEQDDVHAEAD